MKLPELLDKYLSRDEINGFLQEIGLKPSNDRSEGFARLIEGIKGMSSRKVLGYLSTSTLQEICIKNKIPVPWIFTFTSTARDGMIKEICDQLIEKAVPELEAQGLKLYYLLIEQTTKDDLQTILYNMQLSISGNKDELLSRILQTTSTWKLEDILVIFEKETLASICITIGLPPTGSKANLIEKIMLKEFGITPEKKLEKKNTHTKTLREGNIPDKIILDEETGIEPKEDLLFNILNKYASKDDIKLALAKKGLLLSGNKEELIARLLTATENNPEKTLNSMDGITLQNMAEKLGIPRRRSKEDQIIELMSDLFGSPKTEKQSVIATNEKYLPELQQIKPSIQGKEVTFNELIDLIYQWTPSNSYSHESGYQGELATWLTAKGLKTRQRKGDTEVDILVNDKFPIEMKKEPRLGEYDRALGQIIRHCDAWGCIILVMCDVKRMDQYEDFEDRVNRKLVDVQHIIIKK